MSFIIVLLISLGFSDNASLFCIKLESLSIGCFPNEDHNCRGNPDTFRNAEQDNAPPERRNCSFYKNLQVHLKADQNGPIPFKCKSWRENSACYCPPNQICEIAGTCSPDDCETPFEPVCSQKCESCVEDIHIQPVQVQPNGCSIGSDGSTGGSPPCRKRCDDEPYWSMLPHDRCMNQGGGQNIPGDFVACIEAVPNCSGIELPEDKRDYIPFAGNLMTCVGINPCPQYVRHGPGGWETVTENTPDARPVEIRGPRTPGECQIIQPGPPPVPRAGAQCPWMHPWGYYRTNCEPVPECCKWPKVENYETRCPNGCQVPSLPEGANSSTPKSAGKKAK